MTLRCDAPEFGSMGLAARAFAGAAAAIFAMAAPGVLWAKPAPAGDIATTIMADPHYAMAAKTYVRRRGYQAERPVAKRSNFLPVVSAVVVAATGVTLAAKGLPASH